MGTCSKGKLRLSSYLTGGSRCVPLCRVNSAVFLDEVKAAHWGRFQRVCGHALERLGSLNMASASLLDMHLDSSLGCVHIAHSCFWELLFATPTLSPGKL